MVYVIDRNHVALSASRDVREICGPLFDNLGFNYFNYSRLFDDFSHTSLTSNPNWADFFYQHDYKNKFLYSENIVNMVGDYRFLLWSDFKQNSLIKNLNDYFDTDHGIIILEKGVGYTDFYSFAFPSSCNNSTYFLNNFHLLENFIHYFRERACKLINTANSNRIYISEPKNKETMNFGFLNKIRKKNLSININPEKFLENNNVSRYYTKEFDFYLTKREIQCLKLYACGYSTKQIGQILKISHRTVETHLISIKQKSKISNKGGILNLYNDYFPLSSYLNDG